ncbi:hypothetical protein [Nannocystis pusilla]|uniref:hypothetical protein n=1 Tax=Nannocystis pusilla TaxID=889268 RepID=UPI003BF1C36F
MRQSNHHDPPEPEQEVRSALHADLHPDWETLAAPLDPPALDALIDQAIARKAAADAGPTKVTPLRRRRWLPPLLIAGAVAAGLTLILRPDGPVDPFELEMHPGHAQQRGDAPGTGPSFIYDLRNEPLWTIHLPERAADDELQLYLVAQTESGLELLKPQIERRGAAFRVLGELGELGLRPSTVTLHFVLGPRAREAEVVPRLQAHLAGAALPSAWQVQSRGIRITE